jgi:membrane protein implicated in regulation of membrane protease activity
MASYWVWGILAMVLVGAELFTGTFYFLALGVAFAIGGLAAWLGATPAVQLAVAGVLSVVGVFAAHRWCRRRGTPTEQAPLDIGQAVRVQAWHPDGTARVAYRGSLWTAEAERADAARADTMYIVAMRGSTLILSPQRPPTHA